MRNKIADLQNQFDVFKYRVKNLDDLLTKFKFLNFKKFDSNNEKGLLFCKYCCTNPSQFTKNNILNGRIVYKNAQKSELNKLTQSASRHESMPSHIDNVKAIQRQTTTRDVKIVALHLKAVHRVVKSKQSAIFYFLFFFVFFVIVHIKVQTQ